MKDDKNINSKNAYNGEDYNLGLDADRSSEGDTPETKWNGDNDRISGNAAGESDDIDNDSAEINSPLDDK